MAPVAAERGPRPWRTGRLASPAQGVPGRRLIKIKTVHSQPAPAGQRAELIEDDLLLASPVRRPPAPAHANKYLLRRRMAEPQRPACCHFDLQAAEGPQPKRAVAVHGLHGPDEEELIRFPPGRAAVLTNAFSFQFLSRCYCQEERRARHDHLLGHREWECNGDGPG